MRFRHTLISVILIVDPAAASTTTGSDEADREMIRPASFTWKGDEEQAEIEISKKPVDDTAKTSIMERLA